MVKFGKNAWQFFFSGKKRYDFVKRVYWWIPEPVRRLLDGFKVRYVSRHLLKRAAMAVSMHGNVVEHEIPDWLKRVKLEGEMLVIIPCAFEFCELVNQRPINAAKYFSARGYFVVFVVWQWSRDDAQENRPVHVWPGVFQVALFEFLDCRENFPSRRKKALYIVSFPAPVLVDFVPELRKKGYAIIYDIMDEWEEFSKVGQAIWYEKDVEESLVLQSDLVTAVAPSLVDKFTPIRKDIVLIGNGYTPDVLGCDHKDVSRRLSVDHESKNFTIGYFGHLTDAWFDWSLLFETSKNYPEVRFEIIGYGASVQMVKKITNYPNIKLLGKVVPSELHVFVCNWDAAIIPFLPGKLAEAVDPIKIYEYIYFGLSVFVTGMPHLSEYPGVVAHDRGDVVQNFGKFIESVGAQSIKNKVERAEFLEKTTWDARFDCLVKNVGTKIILGDLYVV